MSLVGEATTTNLVKPDAGGALALSSENTMGRASESFRPGTLARHNGFYVTANPARTPAVFRGSTGPFWGRATIEAMEGRSALSGGVRAIG
jgi:hypothetical protein